MDNYIISAQQINAILNILGEFPAKQVIGGIELLRNLTKQEVVKQPESPQA